MNVHPSIFGLSWIDHSSLLTFAAKFMNSVQNVLSHLCGVVFIGNCRDCPHSKDKLVVTVCIGSIFVCDRVNERNLNVILYLQKLTLI